MRRATIAAAGAAFLVACLPGSPADSPERVHDLRILAVRLDPPEVEAGLPDDPPVELRVTALAALPGGEAVTFTVRGCTSADSDACGDEIMEIIDDDVLEQPLLDEQSETVPVEPDVPQARVEMSRELPQELLHELLSEAGFSGLSGRRPAFQVEARGEGMSETAFKRLQVSWPDAVYRELLARAGVVVCDEAGQPAGCLPYATRRPNQNPMLLDVEYHREWEERFRSSREVRFEVHPGERIVLLPIPDGMSAEVYQTLVIDLDSRKVLLEDRVELLMYSWFATAGEFDYTITESGRTQGVQNLWIAPRDIPDEGLDVDLWVVVRDSRGGVDFLEVAVRVVRYR